MQLQNQTLLQVKAFINGAWQDTKDTFTVTNPATQDVITKVANCSTYECELAIDAANAAFQTFKHTLAKQRSQYLRKMSDLMLEHKHDLATILTLEQGKPYTEALSEVVYAASFFEWFAEEAKRVYGDVIPSHKQNSQVIVTKEPVGVVLAITPWNFPLAMLTRKAGAAIASGCTVIWKPSKETPLSANALGRIAQMAELPNGVLNIITGSSSTTLVNAFMNSPVIKKVTFTGSTSVGKLLMQQASQSLKKISLELGGNAPFIVFADADIDSAIAGVMASKFRNTGQTCVCANRIYIEDSIYDEFIMKLAKEIEKLKVADGFTDGATQGPLINKEALEKVMKHVSDAIQKGGKIVCGGKVHQLGGTFFEPTLISEANNDMLIALDETFGPVAACFRFHTEEEVIKLANDTEYGLAAYFYTQNLARTFRVANALEAGVIGINDGIFSTESAPFGGVKQSGFGREGSKYGIDDYVNIKYLLISDLK